MDHLDTIFARNCRVERIPKPEAAAFLDANHRLGSTGGRYFYGLFVERSTGASESHVKEGTPDYPLIRMDKIRLAERTSGHRRHGKTPERLHIRGPA